MKDSVLILYNYDNLEFVSMNSVLYSTENIRSYKVWWIVSFRIKQEKKIRFTKNLLNLGTINHYNDSKRGIHLTKAHVFFFFFLRRIMLCLQKYRSCTSFSFKLLYMLNSANSFFFTFLKSTEWLLCTTKADVYLIQDPFHLLSDIAKVTYIVTSLDKEKMEILEGLCLVCANRMSNMFFFHFFLFHSLLA